MPALFPILEALLISTFWYSLELFQQCRFYLLNRSKSLSFHWSLSVLETGKSRRGPSLVIRWLRHDYTVVISHNKLWTSNAMWAGALLWCNNHDWFFHNSRLFFFLLLHANGTELQGNILYWPCDLLARTHNAPHHCNRRKQWITPSLLTELGKLFSVLVIHNAFTGMIEP